MGCLHHEVTFAGGTPIPYNQITFSFAAITGLGGAPGDTWSITTSTPIGHTNFVVGEYVDPGPVEYLLETTYAGSEGGREFWTATGTRQGVDGASFINMRWGTVSVSMAGLHIVDLCSNAPVGAVGWKVAWS